MAGYSIWSVLRNAAIGNSGWTPAWRDPDPKPSYDVVIVGSGHGLATAYYLAKEHGIANVAGGTTLFRIGPEKIWIALVSGRDAASRLQQVFAADEAVVTDLSQSRTVLHLSGPGTPALLARSVAVDLDDAAFPRGAFAQTLMYETGILLHRAEDEAFDLYVPRSYALAAWERLNAA